MTQQPRIAVICGGNSAEAEVSETSGREVANALRQRYHDVHSLPLDENLLPQLLELGPDVVFPVLHGSPGEDGTLQGALEILGLPYVGSGVLACACAMDKTVAKTLFAQAQLPIIPGFCATRGHDLAQLKDDILNQLGTHVVIKPNASGSALGVHLIDSAEQILPALKSAFELDKTVLIEKRIYGREITVGILHTDHVTAMPVTEITTPENSWYDFEHRYTKGFSNHQIPALLPEEKLKQLQKITVNAHQVLGCRDLSRADFIVDDQLNIYLLEVNVIPGMTPTSLYPDAAEAMGITFAELVSVFIQQALHRASKEETP